jgi:hypothetical protein
MDRRVNPAIFAIVLLMPAPGMSTGAMHSLVAPTAAWEQQAASQSSDAAQSAASKKEANTPPAGSAMHSITVQFDYDFTKTPACAAKLTTACVQKFNVYDISGEKPYLLFSVPVPQNAQGAMKGITASSPRMLFAIGRHRIGVSAQMPDGEKSPPHDCKVIIEIKADSAPNPPASH